eukprot:SAG11_NODE_234_length_11857_cov_15.265776_9_plen_92_part_00
MPALRARESGATLWKNEEQPRRLSQETERAQLLAVHLEMQGRPERTQEEGIGGKVGVTLAQLSFALVERDQKYIGPPPAQWCMVGGFAFAS